MAQARSFAIAGVVSLMAATCLAACGGSPAAPSPGAMGPVAMQAWPTSNGVPTAGDLNCPYHLAVWQNLGMPSSQQADEAAACPGVDPHGASIVCGANYPRWVALFR